MFHTNFAFNKFFSKIVTFIRQCGKVR